MPKGVYERTSEMLKEASKKSKKQMLKQWQDKKYRKQMSETHSHPISKEHKINISCAMYGIKKTEQTKQNMSKAAKLRAGNSRENMLEPSSIELKVKAHLEWYNIEFVQQMRMFDGERYYFLDFYIPSLKLVVECNGDYWHNIPRVKQRDAQLKSFVERSGKKIIFIWESEIMNKDFDILECLEEM